MASCCWRGERVRVGVMEMRLEGAELGHSCPWLPAPRSLGLILRLAKESLENSESPKMRRSLGCVEEMGKPEKEGANQEDDNRPWSSRGKAGRV